MFDIYFPQKFNSSTLKNGGWKMILSYWVSVAFQGRTVKLQEGMSIMSISIQLVVEPTYLKKYAPQIGSWNPR